MTAQAVCHPSRLPAARQRFAHPSEQLLAALFDVAGVPWEYEPVEFALGWDDDGVVRSAFRPDFWLPRERCFVELTTADQRLVTRKNTKARRMRHLYPEIDVVVLYQRDFEGPVARLGVGGSSYPAA